MILLNTKESRLEIIIEDSAPEEFKDRIVEALLASIRWFAVLDRDGNARDVDRDHIHTTTELLEAIIIKPKKTVYASDTNKI